MEVAIETFDLTKRFGTLTAVDMLNLRVESGSIHGFLGPNGAGKTTTIKILVGLLKPDSGSARILGKEVAGDDPEVRQRLGYMPELPKFPKHLTGHELLDVYGRMYGMSTQQLRKDIPQLLDKVGLSGRGGNRLGEYSKGMQQRLGIAQALLNDPKLIILDEPTIGLDPVGMVEVRNLIQSIVKEGTTVFLSSHLLHEVQQICSHITIINRGISIASGTLEEVSNKLTGTNTLHLEVIGHSDAMVNIIKQLTFVTEVLREGQRLTVVLNTPDNVRSQISQIITKQEGIIVHMVQTGKDLEAVFLQLISESESMKKMIHDDTRAKSSTLSRFFAVVKYELLWNIRKKKILGLVILVFGLAILSLVLPVVLSNIYDRPLEADPDHVINTGVFLGELGFFLLAIVTSMNSISGEFESGTIVPLLTKPVSRTTVFLGKLFAAFLTLLATYTLLFLCLTVGGVIVYGPQNNLHLVALILLGSLLSTFVWLGIVLAIGSVSKSSLTAALGAFGIWLGLNLGIGIFSIFSGETWILTYIPGGGSTGYLKMGDGTPPMSGLAVKTGTGSIAENLVTHILNPTAEVNFIKFELTGAGPQIIEVFTETLIFVVMRSLLVASIYIFIFSFIAWVALQRAQITE